MISKNKKILVSISIVFVILLVAGVTLYLRGKKGKTLAAQEVAKIAIDYINQNLLEKGATASLVSIVDEGQVYKMHFKIGDQEYDSYLTKDAQFLFPQGISLKSTTPANQETEKRDRPDVKLFVMSYCPYGLQMEKAFLPVYNLLKDKAEMSIYFVNYIMHEKKEIDENLRQYCIQKEEKEKFINYLGCFVKNGDAEKCLSETNIDRGKLSSCEATTDRQFNIYSQYNDKNTWLNGRYPKFDIYSDLNQKYGIKGSPTLVINDKIIEVSTRSAEELKKVICQVFNSQPSECSQTLSNDVPQPGFGEGTGTSNGGSCQ